MQQMWSKSMQQCRKRWHYGQTDEWIARGDHNIPMFFSKYRVGGGGGGGGGGWL